MLARLHHTHIVPIHAAGQQGPWQYFAMAYVEGASLGHVLRTSRQAQTPGTRGKTTLPGLVEEAMRQSRLAASHRTRHEKLVSRSELLIPIALTLHRLAVPLHERVAAREP